MPVILDQGGAECVIRLEGEVNITSAVEFKTLLVQALASGKELRVSVERAAELDITALQLLVALERATKKAGTQVVLAGKVPEAVAANALEAGFKNFPIPADPGLKGA